ncbi:hypothetical protein GCM10012288_05210 [Malaciobacter pacificus]|uniref:Uncharacterized protein n=1 Tax=Malaciobacter pacificus TaxID=1080223 RepID=A0A5C2H688_9BACT|nr:hypothetical protein [Malaciobacter pacificus]QEP34481.1 hypothetical protein APAC_1367 [Malaciobacter pacificus]GGD34194.1 hypothetical protein GCM10012288_05210 [Malaciobacter pacificus]
MKLFSNTLIIVGTIFLFYYLYKIYKLYQEEVAKEKEEAQKPSLLQIAIQEALEEDLLYELNTHKVRYSLYNPNFQGLHEFNSIYKLVVHDNLWINEPFHSKFYEFLLLINDNDFMIIDPYSKVITMNVRDKYNKVQTSKSYQVYSTKDIIKHMISYCMDDITRFNKKDAQNLLISIFIVALKQSVHYLSKDVPQNIIDKMLKDYKEALAIKNIVHMVETEKEKVYFIQEALYDAFSVVETLPYNDSEVSKALEVRKELPQKLLQSI